MVLMRQVSNSTTLGTSEVCFTIPKAELTLRMSQMVEGESRLFPVHLPNYKGNQGLTNKQKIILSFPKVPNFFSGSVLDFVPITSVDTAQALEAEDVSMALTSQ